MKEFVVIHDYLVSESVVGDWDGEEEVVAEKVNEIYHTLYHLAEEDISSDVLSQLLEKVWETWIGLDVLPDLETDDIYSWCQHMLENRDQYLED